MIGGESFIIADTVTASSFDFPDILAPAATVKMAQNASTAPLIIFLRIFFI